MVFIFRYMHVPSKGMEESPVPFSVMKMLKETGASTLVTSASNSDELLFNGEKTNLRNEWDRLAKECGSEANLIAYLKKIASSKTQIEVMGADGKTFMDSPDPAERRLAAIMLVAFSGEFAIPSFSMYSDGSINSQMLQQAIYKYIYNVTADAKDKKIEWDPAVDGGYKAATMLYDAGEAKVDQAISVEKPIEGVQTLSEKKPGKVTDIDIPQHEEPPGKTEFTGKYDQRTFDLSKIRFSSTQTTLYGASNIAVFRNAFASANSSFLAGGQVLSDETLWKQLADPNNQDSLLSALRNAPSNMRQAWYNAFHTGSGQGTEQDFINFVNMLTKGGANGQFGNGNPDAAFSMISPTSPMKNLTFAKTVLDIRNIAQNPDLVNYLMQHARVDIKLVAMKSPSAYLELKAYFDYSTGVLTLTNAIPGQSTTDVKIKGTEFGVEVGTYFPDAKLFADLGWSMKTQNFSMNLYGSQIDVANTQEQKFYANVGALLQLGNKVSIQPAVIAMYKTQTAEYPLSLKEKNEGNLIGLTTTMYYNPKGKVSPYVGVGVFRIKDYSGTMSTQELVKVGSKFKIGKFELDPSVSLNFSDKSKMDYQLKLDMHFSPSSIFSIGGSYKRRQK